MPKRFVLVARKPPIEPLGLHYLDEIPRQVGWDSNIVLIENNNFEPLFEIIRAKKPDMVGFHVWAGYHLPMLAAADTVRALGIPVIMGGPYPTYAYDKCVPHADWVIRSGGFRLLKQALEGSLKKGVHFDITARYEGFPIPSRETIYGAYPEYGKSPIKSIFGSEGCPYKCSYCHAPEKNKMHGGFDAFLRPIGDIVAEAQIVMRGWPETKLFYFQDDIFGFDEKVWLPEFAKRWKQEVGVPFHCQMRLEMTRHASGDARLDLFVEAGCSGITLAIESDNEFLRDQVLFRSMPDHLILEGCKKIMDRGMTLRTEQILAVPFSDITTDLGTLDLNNRINPTMAWTSILSPYPGVPIGTIAKNFGLWEGTDDDLKELFFYESVLKHVKGGPRVIEQIVRALPHDQQKDALLRMTTANRTGHTADVYYQHVKKEKVGKATFVVNVGSPERVGAIEYLSPEENDLYCKSTVRLQNLFMGLAKMPKAKELGGKLVALTADEWAWKRIGEVTTAHLLEVVPAAVLEGRSHALAREMGFSSPEEFPKSIAQNPHYFTYFPSSGMLAKKIVKQRVFGPGRSTKDSLHDLATIVRRHLFDLGLYKVVESLPPIAA